MMMLSHNESREVFNTHFKQTLDTLHRILKALQGFENNHDKKFNISKLMTQLELNLSLMDEIIYLLLNFQELFHKVLKNYKLTKQIIDRTVYFIPKKKIEEEPSIPTKILIRKSHLQIFSDIVYVFKFVKRGKGFEIETNGFDLLDKIKKLKDYYPYLFIAYENLTYLSPLGLELGELLLSYHKSNKEVYKLSLSHHIFEVINDK
jgi:hypothetical protein